MFSEMVAAHGFSHCRNDVDGEAVRVRHVSGHEVHTAFLEAGDEVKVSGKPVEPG